MKDLIFALTPAICVVLIIVLFTFGLYATDSKVENSIVLCVTILGLIVAVMSIWRTVDVVRDLFGPWS